MIDHIVDAVDVFNCSLMIFGEMIYTGMAFGAVVNTTDFHLIEKVLSGSEQAFEELMEQHMDSVYGIALRIVKNPELAEEVTQEVFIIVFKKLRSFRKESAFSTWIYRITVNHALRSLKKEKRYFSAKEAEEIPEPTDKMSNPEEQIIKEEHCVMVREFMKELPDKQRAVLALRLEKELPFKEIAHILGRSVGGVKSNYFHAVQKIKAAWERRGKHERV